MTQRHGPPLHTTQHAQEMERLMEHCRQQREETDHLIATSRALTHASQPWLETRQRLLQGQPDVKPKPRT